MTSARAQALIALWTYWQLAGLGSMALAPSALSVLWRLALIASVDSLALAQAKWLLLLSGLSGSNGDHALIALKDLVALTLLSRRLALIALKGLPALCSWHGFWLWHFSAGSDLCGSCSLDLWLTLRHLWLWLSL